MDAFMMIQRKKLTIFTDAKDNILVHELKKIISCIIKVPPQNQQLYYKDEIMDDTKTLTECGLNANIAKAQCPAIIGLALRTDDGEFEALDMVPYSSPPELPYVMKNQEANGQEPPM
ncbi:elongin-B [Adelges cooleyi]|uniref:elongin-B n=1 Tax=Adelges cooleyi TaxID=133065 RepID=UPI00218024EF|nr:elongin-B [Adelges cooleyi]